MPTDPPIQRSATMPKLVRRAGTPPNNGSFQPVMQPSGTLSGTLAPGALHAQEQAKPGEQHSCRTGLRNDRDPLTLTRVRESGVEGYLEKDNTPEKLEEAMMEVASGRPFFSARFMETLMRENAKPEGLGKILSRREQEVLTQIIAGKTSREVAGLYGIGLRTVEFHRANVMAELGASNTAELLAQARSRGMI